MFFFFFSSRRRHTRSLCDWSSDVCSSDLRQGFSEADLIDFTPELHKKALEITSRYSMGPLYTPPLVRDESPNRSEERRVGKECRSRWGHESQKEKKETGSVVCKDRRTTQQ